MIDIDIKRKKWELEKRPHVGCKADAVRADLFDALAEIERLNESLADAWNDGHTVGRTTKRTIVIRTNGGTILF